MASTIRVLLEVGPRARRAVAGATDWPGLDRWGRNDDEALTKLAAYLPRYEPIAENNADGTIAGRTWSVQFLVRRIAHHVMDHAWEMEDRDLTE